MLVPVRVPRLTGLVLAGWVLLSACSSATDSGSDAPGAPDAHGTFVEVSAGAEHSCALTAAGEAFCWGTRTLGRLGVGAPLPTADQPWPRRVEGGQTFSLISAGLQHSCALDSSGLPHCWGYNHFGELGDGDTTVVGNVKHEPVRALATKALVSLSSSWHSCGVETTGLGICWGPDFAGGLGDGGGVYIGHRTVSVGVVSDFRVISTGGSEFSCGLDTSGYGYCWGYGAVGQIANNSPSSVTLPTPMLGGRSYDAVVAGFAFACAIEVGGALYCWGDNHGGQLGDATTIDKFQPTPVTGGLTFRSVTAGGTHTCGISSDDAVYCWGDNTYGQLGDGSTASSLTPRLTLAGYTMESLSAGLDHTCGIATDGVTYCWGRNQYGQLGDGSFTNRLDPVEVQ